MYKRKILLGFIRAHILHHAASDEGVYGTWMMNELKEHGYSISPGTLYPILHEMEDDGSLEAEDMTVEGKVRKVYRITPMGAEVLSELKGFIDELSREVLD
jgi:DNA-binding PadR family transcriptional regulator